MNSTMQKSDPAKFDVEMTFRLPTLAANAEFTQGAIQDAARVTVGGQGPVFRLADTGRVRLGGQGPAFRRLSVTDTGRVRLGGQGPIFR